MFGDGLYYIHAQMSCECNVHNIIVKNWYFYTVVAIVYYYTLILWICTLVLSMGFYTLYFFLLLFHRYLLLNAVKFLVFVVHNLLDQYLIDIFYLLYLSLLRSSQNQYLCFSQNAVSGCICVSMQTSMQRSWITENVTYVDIMKIVRYNFC